MTPDEKFALCQGIEAAMEASRSAAAEAEGRIRTAAAKIDTEVEIARRQGTDGPDRLATFLWDLRGRMHRVLQTLDHASMVIDRCRQTHTLDDRGVWPSNFDRAAWQARQERRHKMMDRYQSNN